ncbi:MAG: hypothetical protein HON90_10580 [Halobacteriovoraceae bacterium]|nr:hypothetical protein [Halobacteriovoraceae bacterium]
MKKLIVLTGKFIKDIKTAKQLVQREGFEVQESLDDNTQVLLVGDGEKSYWATSETGNLIHEATRFNNKGSAIEIMFEIDFFNDLSSKNTSIQAQI